MFIFTKLIFFLCFCVPTHAIEKNILDDFKYTKTDFFNFIKNNIGKLDHEIVLSVKEPVILEDSEKPITLPRQQVYGYIVKPNFNLYIPVRFGLEFEKILNYSEDALANSMKDWTLVKIVDPRFKKSWILYNSLGGYYLLLGEPT